MRQYLGFWLDTLINGKNIILHTPINPKQMRPIRKFITATVVCIVLFAISTQAQPPVRDPHTPGYVTATELPDGAVPSPNAFGDFIIGPTHSAAPEATPQPGVPQGTIYQLVMESKDSKIYPGIAR